jgi:c-di-GMP-related signal transduction protein
MNKVEIMAKKSSLTKIVIKYYNIIKRQYGFKVAIIYINKETSLTGKFNKWVAEQGITLKRSAPNT